MAAPGYSGQMVGYANILELIMQIPSEQLSNGIAEASDNIEDLPSFDVSIPKKKKKKKRKRSSKGRSQQITAAQATIDNDEEINEEINPNQASSEHGEEKLHISPGMCVSSSTHMIDSKSMDVRTVTDQKYNPLEQNRALLAQAWKFNIHEPKKLLVLDVNGLLVARYKKSESDGIPLSAKYIIVGKRRVYKRPSCEAFLNFCFENFHVGIWSSMKEDNVRKALNYICKKTIHRFVFVMHQGDCTNTGFQNPENRMQPLFLKELTSVWSKFPHGEFNQSNTLLIDDTPYKALRNLPHTAIFPQAYLYNEADNFLMGVLRDFLEQLRDAIDVQEFVRSHPIGEPAIAAGCPHWQLYQKVLDTNDREVSISKQMGNSDGAFCIIPSGNRELQEAHVPSQEQGSCKESVVNVALIP